jgi:hypothetical protein
MMAMHMAIIFGGMVAQHCAISRTKKKTHNGQEGRGPPPGRQQRQAGQAGRPARSGPGAFDVGEFEPSVCLFAENAAPRAARFSQPLPSPSQPQHTRRSRSQPSASSRVGPPPAPSTMSPSCLAAPWARPAWARSSCTRVSDCWFSFVSSITTHTRHAPLTKHARTRKTPHATTAPTYVGPHLEDGGADLSLPGGFVSTLHDGVYISSAALLLGAFWSGGLALLGAFPAYGLTKLWTGVVAPFFFSARPEEVEAEEKARAAAEKRARKAGKVRR